MPECKRCNLAVVRLEDERISADEYSRRPFFDHSLRCVPEHSPSFTGCAAASATIV